MELLQLCAFLDPDAKLPLDRLTAPAPLLPDALRAEVDADIGLGGPLGLLDRLGLIAREGTAGRMHPVVRDVVRSRLTDDEAVTWFARAALLVLAALPYLSGRPEAELDEAARLVPHAIRMVDDPAADAALTIMLLDQAGGYLAARDQTSAAIALLERSQVLREETYAPDDQESEDARVRRVEGPTATERATQAARLGLGGVLIPVTRLRASPSIAGQALPKPIECRFKARGLVATKTSTNAERLGHSHVDANVGRRLITP